MVLGLSLRRKKPKTESFNVPIRPSLSLPDLSRSLQDIHKWADLPFTPKETGLSTSRRRKSSVSSPSTQFHRPFSPLRATYTDGFRVSAAIEEKRDSTSNTTSRATFRSQRRAKQPAAFNVVIAGGRGAGKTSLLRLLSESLVPNKPLPKSVAATSCISSSTIDVRGPGLEHLTLKLYDTPGLALGATQASELVERERGASGLVTMLEEKLAMTLREQSKVVRRQPNSEDQLIHLVIYFVDARNVLRPAAVGTDVASVSWSEQEDSQADDSGPPKPALAIEELDIIGRLSVRANVLTTLGHSDSLTSSELELVKCALRRDLASRFGQAGGCGFGVFWDDDALGNGESILESDEQAVIGRVPPSPTASEQSTGMSTSLPFALFMPNTGARQREYKWGIADVYDPKHSDFVLLKETILGSFSKILRQTTREILYEQYRTERLTAQHAAADNMPRSASGGSDWAIV